MVDSKLFGVTASEGSFSVATYNVHRWIGADGHCNPSRVMRVIQQLDADVIGLQEATFPETGQCPGLEAITRATGFQAVLGPTFFRQDAHFGNILLTTRDILDVRRIDLSISNREPRGALDVKLDVQGMAVRVIVTHLGLRASERRVQIQTLFETLSMGPDEFIVLMGDFNEWFPASGSLRRIRSWFGLSPAFRTFPSHRPLLPLDRIWVRPVQALTTIRVYRTPLTRIASDHLPVKATMVADGVRNPLL